MFSNYTVQVVCMIPPQIGETKETLPYYAFALSVGTTKRFALRHVAMVTCLGGGLTSLSTRNASAKDARASTTWQRDDSGNIGWNILSFLARERGGEIHSRHNLSRNPFRRFLGPLVI